MGYDGREVAKSILANE